jgi:hypothetical protein
VEKYGKARQATDDNIRGLRIACWILQEVTLFAQNTADLKQYTLKNNPQSYGVSAVHMG